jgi:hypothetical protein
MAEGGRLPQQTSTPKMQQVMDESFHFNWLNNDALGLPQPIRPNAPPTHGAGTSALLDFGYAPMKQTEGLYGSKPYENNTFQSYDDGEVEIHHMATRKDKRERAFAEATRVPENYAGWTEVQKPTRKYSLVHYADEEFNCPEGAISKKAPPAATRKNAPGSRQEWLDQPGTTKSRALHEREDGEVDPPQAELGKKEHASATTKAAPVGTDTVMPPKDSAKDAQESGLDMKKSVGRAAERRQHMKPGKFDGTGSIEAFLSQFEICAARNEWTEPEKVDFLRCALEKNATQLLWDFGATKNPTYENLIGRLRQRYGYDGQMETYRTELKCRRQQPGETLASLQQDIRRLMALAHPGPTNETLEAMATDAFMTAIYDAEISLKVREQEPKSIDAAFRTAMRLEALKAGYSRDRDDQRRPPNRVRGMSTPNDEPPWVSAFMARFDSMEAGQNDLKAGQRDLNYRVMGLEGGYERACNTLQTTAAQQQTSQRNERDASHKQGASGPYGQVTSDGQYTEESEWARQRKRSTKHADVLLLRQAGARIQRLLQA